MTNVVYLDPPPTDIPGRLELLAKRIREGAFEDLDHATVTIRRKESGIVTSIAYGPATITFQEWAGILDHARTNVVDAGRKSRGEA